MAFIKFNAHPKGLNVNDCVVRAVSTTLNKDYMETRKELNRAKRELGYSDYKKTKFLYEYLKDYERIKFKGISGMPRIKVKDFMRNHPKGTYILKVRHHVTSCIDGDILDTWDCTYLTVYTAWLIKK